MKYLEFSIIRLFFDDKMLTFKNSTHLYCIVLLSRMIRYMDMIMSQTVSVRHWILSIMNSLFVGFFAQWYLGQLLLYKWRNSSRLPRTSYPYNYLQLYLDILNIMQGSIDPCIILLIYINNNKISFTLTGQTASLQKV